MPAQPVMRVKPGYTSVKFTDIAPHFGMVAVVVTVSIDDRLFDFPDISRLGFVQGFELRDVAAHPQDYTGVCQ